MQSNGARLRQYLQTLGCTTERQKGNGSECRQAFTCAGSISSASSKESDSLFVNIFTLVGCDTEHVGHNTAPSAQTSTSNERRQAPQAPPYRHHETGWR